MDRTFRFVVVAVVLAAALPAEAARWKVGTRPAGTTYQQRQAIDGGWCYYDPNDSGTPQCRWKKTTLSGVSGCYWYREQGYDQDGCNPPPAGTNTVAPDPWAPKTFTSSRGSLKISPYRTTGANTYAAHIEATLAFTGERVRFDIRFQNAIGSSTVTPLGHQITGIDATTKMELRGITGTRTPIYRTGGTVGGVPTPPGGWVPQPPGSLPPTGETCYYAWNSFMSQQMNCFAAAMSGFWSNAWRGAVLSAGVSAVYCLPWGAAGGIGGPEMTLATYAACIVSKAGPGFVNVMLGGIMLGEGIPNMSNNSICNADEFARQRLSQACGTSLP